MVGRCVDTGDWIVGGKYSDFTKKERKRKK